ncbi:MAG: hypothetical protein GY830_05390 [Bacteroidetes bacterium]|nr:hypothetical protein [Bacteroidota bacterium]
MAKSYENWQDHPVSCWPSIFMEISINIDGNIRNIHQYRKYQKGNIIGVDISENFGREISLVLVLMQDFEGWKYWYWCIGRPVGISLMPAPPSLSSPAPSKGTASACMMTRRSRTTQHNAMHHRLYDAV